MGHRAVLLSVGLIACLVTGVVLLSKALGPQVLGETEVKQLLSQLPYRIRFRPVRIPEGADGAIAGTAIGRHQTVVHFGVSLGTGYHPVRFPRPVITEATGGETFLVSNDVTIQSGNGIAWGRQFRTEAQQYEAARIVTDIEQKLCRATTGEPCAI